MVGQWLRPMAASPGVISCDVQRDSVDPCRKRPTIAVASGGEVDAQEYFLAQVRHCLGGSPQAPEEASYRLLPAANDFLKGSRVAPLPASHVFGFSFHEFPRQPLCYTYGTAGSTMKNRTGTSNSVVVWIGSARPCRDRGREARGVRTRDLESRLVAIEG